MPSTRLVRVAAAMRPEDFNICDIAPDSKDPLARTKEEKEVPSSVGRILTLPAHRKLVRWRHSCRFTVRKPAGQSNRQHPVVG